MGTGTIVLVESDDWVARLLEAALREAGYDVSMAAEALEGLQRSTERKPECVVAASKLPDFDGAWVVSQIRASSSKLAETPFLLLSEAEGDEVVDPAFRAGADAVIAKPFRVREVVAQVNALVGMAARLRRPSERDAGPILSLRPSLFPTEALRGSLAQMSLSMVLTLLEMERRSGRVRISREGEDATIDLASGYATTASIDGQPTPLVRVLRQLLAWRSGLVSFVVGRKVPPPPGSQPIAALLMQAMQAPPIPKAPRIPTLDASLIPMAPQMPTSEAPLDSSRARARGPQRTAPARTRGMLTPPPMAPPRVDPK